MEQLQDKMKRGCLADRAALWLLALTMVAVPLALAPPLAAFDVTPKLIALLAGACAVWLALAMAGRLPASSASACRLLPANLRGFFFPLAILAVCGVLASIFSTDRVLSLAGSEWRRLGLPAWLACLALAAAVPLVTPLGEGDGRRLLLQAIAVTGTVAAIYSFAQYSGHDPWINPGLYRIGEGEWQIVRPPATFGYVSYFALYEAAAIFVAAGLAISASRSATKVAWSCAATAMAIAVILTGSRGALLGMAAGVVVLVWRGGDRRRRRALLAATLAVAAITAALVASPLGQPVRSRVRWFVEDPEGGGRLQLWRDAAKLAVARPLLGVGLDTFGREFAPFESLELAQRFPDRFVESPHNTFLDYATNAGAPAVLCFLTLMIVAFRSAWRAGDAALLAALTAGLLAAQFVADTITTRLLLLSLAALTLPAAPRQQAGRASRWVVGLCAVLTAIVTGVYGSRLVSADRAAFQAQSALSKGNLDMFVQAGRAAADAFPWAGAYAYRQSRLLGQVSMIPNLPGPARGFVLLQAEGMAREALPHTEQPGAVHLQLASVEGLQGRFPEAQLELEAAMRASPAWFRPRWQLAVLLSQEGRWAEAAAQASAALERGARGLPDVSQQCVRIQTLARDHTPAQ
jgi:hypothetical protein